MSLLAVCGCVLLAGGLAWCHRERMERQSEARTARVAMEARSSQGGGSTGPGARAARKPLPPKPANPQLQAFREFLDGLDAEELQRAKLLDRFEHEGAEVFAYEIRPTGENVNDFGRRWVARMPKVDSADMHDLMGMRVVTGFIPADLKRIVTIRMSDEGREMSYVATDVEADTAWSRDGLPEEASKMSQGRYTFQDGEERRADYLYLMKLAEKR